MDKNKEFDTYYTSLDDISAPIEDVYYESFSGKHHKAKVKLPNSVTVNLKENHLCKMNFESVEPLMKYALRWKMANFGVQPLMGDNLHKKMTL